MLVQFACSSLYSFLMLFILGLTKQLTNIIIPANCNHVNNGKLGNKGKMNQEYITVATYPQAKDE